MGKLEALRGSDTPCSTSAPSVSRINIGPRRRNLSILRPISSRPTKYRAHAEVDTDTVRGAAPAVDKYSLDAQESRHPREKYSVILRFPFAMVMIAELSAPCLGFPPPNCMRHYALCALFEIDRSDK